jgi:putative sigma-54 modulation protein
MNIEISGRNYEVNDRIRKLIESKLDKLQKLFTDIIEIRCVLHVEKYRNICDIVVVGKDYDLKAAQEADTMEDAVQSSIDHLKRQAQKSKKKIRDQRRGGSATLPESWELNIIEPSQMRTDTAAPRIIEKSRIPIRPMSIEQAALLLDSSKNEFIVFRDLDTDKVTVIYRRRDQNFGMIAPEF